MKSHMVWYNVSCSLVLVVSACVYYLSTHPIGDTVSMARSQIIKNLKEKDGKYVIQKFYQNGDVMCEKEYVISDSGVPIQSGIATYWNLDGTIDKQVFWKDGVCLGPVM